MIGPAVSQLAETLVFDHPFLRFTVFSVQEFGWRYKYSRWRLEQGHTAVLAPLPRGQEAAWSGTSVASTIRHQQLATHHGTPKPQQQEIAARM